jgi:hypothetical protein
MGEERKTPRWPWIVALLIGLPALYVASFGPAYRLFSSKLVSYDRLMASIDRSCV